jgi:uncharacterized protein (TIGR00255 family)
MRRTRSGASRGFEIISLCLHEGSMTIYSMTGYASAGAAAQDAASASEAGAGGNVNVELRSVNGRFLDLSLRLPDELRSLEPALRELVAAAFRRGKIELRASTRNDAAALWPQPQAEQLNRLARLQDSVRGWMPDARPLSVNEALQWCKAGAAAERLDEAVLQAAKDAIAGLQDARAREGERLAKALAERVERLRALAAQAEPLVAVVVRRQQQRFVERWNEALATSGAAQTIAPETLQDRALNEAATFAIRIDIAEELARLRSHLDEIDRLLATGGELGKRLDFLVQELLREANTLGSKSAAIELTNIAVEMKVAIEQLREQVQNLE